MQKKKPTSLIQVQPNKKATNKFYKTEYVRALFNQMASTYSLVNYGTSFGFSLRWRKQFIHHLNGTTDAIKVADLMTGMGETWPFIKSQWQNGEIYAVDISENMLARAGKKNKKYFQNKVILINEDILNNSFPDAHFDVIICAFGLKTLSLFQLEILAKETQRLLKKGGQYSFIEVSLPQYTALRKPYLFYLKRVIPLVGKLLCGNATTYKMLGYYTEKYQNSTAAFKQFEAIGLTPIQHQFSYGCATGFYGIKQ
jgi:ubiquinone/menaquinone biosynthesis methyltransferase